MTTRSGIPATERQELLGKLSQADEARARLSSAVAPLVRQAADKEARRRWLVRRALRAAGVRGRAATRPAARPAWAMLALTAAGAFAVAAAWHVHRHPGRRR